MPEELAPPVVAVVVTSDPGEWFEPCLESLCAQDYPNLAVLVIDDASEIDVTPRVAALEPAAIVRRRASRGGFAAGADEALAGVEGATFFLFCHDDVELDDNAVAMLVEESFRSNAAIVGPKYVGADNPELLMQVGLGMHRLGTPAARVHPGELDQSQHDEARDVFATPGGCVLVRADLFVALEGFDPTMSLFGEDVDFCWRAQIAGARVTVAPQARVKHRQTAASGRREAGQDVELLERRHELRAALKNYGAWRRWPVTAELIILGLAEVLVGMLSGERERSRRVLRAWRWNLSERRSLKAGRQHIREIRQVSDRVLVRRMAGRGRVRRFFRPDPGGLVATDRARRGRPRTVATEQRDEHEPLGSWWARVQRGEVPAAQLTLALALVLLALLGLRDLLFARLPLVGQLVPMPNGSVLLERFLGGMPLAGSVKPAPTAFGLVGLLGLVLGNSSAAAWKLIDIGALVIGAVGVSRLCRPFLSSRGRLVASTAFVGLPLAWNSLATGNVQAAVTLGALPYVFSRVARATRVSPFDSQAAGVGTGKARAVLGEIVPFGLLLAVLGALAPAGLLAAGVVVAAIVVACVLNGRPLAGLRAFGIAVGAIVVAGCCCLPWSLTWFGAGARWSAFAGVVPSTAVLPSSLLRGHTGPVGAWWGAWGLVAAAGYVLLVSRGERIRWASALWLTAIGATALAWAGSEGWLGAGGGDTLVLVAPAAVAVAAACGLGVVAFERDVMAARALGWRQGAALVAAVCLAGGMLPALSVVIGGRADLPSQGVDQTLDWTVPPAHHRYVVLWLGDPRALPAAGWQLAPGLAWYTATTGLPNGAQDWPPANPGALSGVASALKAAEKGRTADVGALLAPFGVRYVVLPVADAPQLPGTQTPPVVAPPPTSLLSLFRSQGDLIERPVEAGAHVFVNADWTPRLGDGTSAALRPPAGAHQTATWREIGVVAGLVAWLAALAEGVTRRRRWDRRPRSGARPGTAAGELGSGGDEPGIRPLAGAVSAERHPVGAR